MSDAAILNDPNDPLDGLTGLQRNFVVEYLKDFNASKAVVRAGYQCKPGNENRLGTKFLKNPRIKEGISRLNAVRMKESGITSDYVLKRIIRTIERVEAAEGTKYDPNAVLRACELLGRTIGLYKDKQEISGPDGGPIETRDVKDNASAFTDALSRLRQRSVSEESGPDLGVVTSG